jgi:ABC-type phosphate/phosphonate transport system substrate-binding protein
MNINACLAAALLSSSTPAVAPAPPVRLATYAYPAYDRRAALAPLARLVERVSGRPVTILLYATPELLATAVQNGDTDLAVTNLAAFARVARLPGARAVAVLAPPPATQERYRGMLLAQRETGLATLADLGRMATRLRYVEVLPGSTSGALVQAEALRRAGTCRGAFRETGHAGTHEAALAALITGTADVAAVAEGPWLALQAQSPETASRLVPLWRSPPLPPGPILCMASATMNCGRIASALTADRPASHAAARMLARGWSETSGARSFVRVDARRYAPFIAGSTP